MNLNVYTLNKGFTWLYQLLNEVTSISIFEYESTGDKPQNKIALSLNIFFWKKMKECNNDTLTIESAMARACTYELIKWNDLCTLIMVTNDWSCRKQQLWVEKNLRVKYRIKAVRKQFSEWRSSIFVINLIGIGCC